MVVQENVCGPAAVVGEEGRGAGRLALASTGRSDGGVSIFFTVYIWFHHTVHYIPGPGAGAEHRTVSGRK